MSIQEKTRTPVSQPKSQTSKLEVVVFDLDDTLYDEVEYCRSGFSAVAVFLEDMLEEEISGEVIFDTLWKHFCKGNHTSTFNTALEEIQIPYNDELISELIKVYREHKPNMKLPQDSLAVLKQLSKKYKLALLTDGFLPAQKFKVQALKIEKFFKCIVYTEELGRDFWKPSPVGFEKILQTLKLNAENAVYIADNEKKDFIAPNRLGFHTIQLIRDAHIHVQNHPNPEYPAQHIIKNIHQLPALLEKL